VSIIKQTANQREQTEKDNNACDTTDVVVARADRAGVTQPIPSMIQGHPANPDNKMVDEVSPETPPDTRYSRQIEINLTQLHKLGMITRYDEKSRIAEEFRIIKRPLIQGALNRPEGHTSNGNLIMVTSAIAGEGKSFCAINLAISIAMEMDHTVLLIDADVARPSMPRYLGIQPDVGLLDILLDDNIELADVIMKTNIENLSILMSGEMSKQSTELLASQSMSDLLTDLSRRYADRIIIFDSPPLLLTTESRVLAAQMGQIVMVVASETTPQKQVMDALAQIKSCHDIKLIYNKSAKIAASAYYGYYD